MIIVTGAYGFIGSNFVKYLNERGHTDILVCDYLTNGRQFSNLNGCKYHSFVTPDALLNRLHGMVENKINAPIEHIHHFGAVSSTTEWNGELVMPRNTQFTLELIGYAVTLNIPISYSSSASVYGNGDGPLNLYAYSKKLVDDMVAPLLPDSQVQGFRYFNVYGPNEAHKGSQASVNHIFTQQALEHGVIKVFEGSENFKRDFVPVETVCEVQYNMSKTNKSGIFDLGTGKQKSFMEIAEEIATQHNARIEIVPFPQHLNGYYQTNTLADMSYLENI